ncbi:MAG TPA: M56 family metallopeptidase [Terriglobales bacterium]|jgi:uncharacterized protein (TIGR03435 family)
MNAAAILNHLWQSTVFAVVAALVAWALRRNSARVGFGVWLAASLKFLVPFSALAAVGSGLGARLPEATAAFPAASVAAAPLKPMVIPITVASLPQASGVPSVWILGGLWLAGSVALAGRWFWQWRRTARMARKAEPRAASGMRLRVTEGAVEPGVFGVFRPVLLVPKGIEARLTAAQFAAVLAHERCHVRRRDNLWAALHRVVETVFWFHPLVWWIGARMIAERERACDEAVLGAGGDARAYAGGILGVCRHYMASPLACAVGVASQSGGPLQRRVREILAGGRGRKLSRGRMLCLASLGAAVVLTPVMAGLLFGQAAPPATFDAIAIHAVPAAGSGKRVMGLHIDPQRLWAENMSLRELILAAWGLQPYQLRGPDWMSGDIFAITGATHAPVPANEMPALLRPFLTRQFELKVHSTREVRPVYRLEVAPGGAKLKPANRDAAPAIMPAQRFSMHLEGRALTLTGTATLQQLVDFLNLQFDRPVLNQTGQMGTYDIRLTFDPKAGVPGAPAGGGPSIFDALPEQLGLRLVSGKAPVDVLVVDSANATPAGN